MLKIYVILGIIAGLFLFKKYGSPKKTRPSDEFGPIGAIFCGATIGFIFFGIFGLVILPEVFPTKQVILYELPLHSIKNTSSVNGSVFLLRATLDTNRYISYCSEDEYGKYIDRVYLDKSRIVEDGDSKVVVYGEAYTDSWMYYFASDSDLKPSLYVFHVPENTVEDTYEVNLE